MIKKRFKFDELVIEDRVIEHLDNEFYEVAKSWFNFQNQWSYNAYKPFKDMEKYIIFLYLVRKTMNFYSENLISYDYKTYFKSNQMEIPKFNIIEISKSLDISKETTRRKILELEKKNIIKREQRKISVVNIINRNQFQFPKKNITIISKFLSDFSFILSKKNIIKKKIDKTIIEKYFFQNFTYSWNLFLNMQIPFMLNWKRIFGDLETSFIFAQCIIQKNAYLKKLKKDDKNYFDKIINKPPAIGINAMSISELCGIPRATVVRKLKKLLKMNALFIDKKKLYHPKYLEDEAHNTFAKQRKLVAVFSTKIYNSIISNNLI